MPTVLRGSAVVPAGKLANPVPLFGVSLLMLDVDLEGGGLVEKSAALGDIVSTLDVDLADATPSNVVEVDEGVYLAGLALMATALILGRTQTPPPAGDPDPEPQPTVLRGNAVWSSDITEPVPLIAVTLWMLDLQIPDEKGPDMAAASPSLTRLERLGVTPDALRSSSVVDAGDGSYLAGVGLVDTDGSFELLLPDGDAIPGALFRPAEASIPVQFYAAGPECSLVASDPEALVTISAFEGFTIASPVFLTSRGLSSGITATEATDYTSETDLATITFVSLAFATAPTTLSVAGADCTPESGTTVSVEVTLQKGWNQITWDYVSRESVTIGDRPMSEPVFSVVVAYGDAL